LLWLFPLSLQTRPSPWTAFHNSLTLCKKLKRSHS
jgi:hypothetical protein